MTIYGFCSKHHVSFTNECLQCLEVERTERSAVHPHQPVVPVVCDHTRSTGGVVQGAMDAPSSIARTVPVVQFAERIISELQATINRLEKACGWYPVAAPLYHTRIETLGTVIVAVREMMEAELSKNSGEPRK